MSETATRPADNPVLYAEDAGVIGDNDVVFIEKRSGKRLVRRFDSPYLAWKFVNKAKRSDKVLLVSYPSKR